MRSKNLPFSTEDVKIVVKNCITCASLKPKFHKPPANELIKALKPFDRISIDFKGPLPQTTDGNRYLLIMVDEFSRYPFAFPCKDISADTVIKCLTEVFSYFGLPRYIHSDRGSSFMSTKVKTFLTDLGIPTSRSTPYHPTGNSQCERYVGVVWKAITLALHSNKLPTSAWEAVVGNALHSIRSLVCTSTGDTPHERIFTFQRKTTSGSSLPTWLLTPGSVLLRKFHRRKDEDLVEEVELLEATPSYAHIRYPSGREDTVSIRDLAPLPANQAQDSRHIESEFPSQTPETEAMSQPIVEARDEEDHSLRTAPPASSRPSTPVTSRVDGQLPARRVEDTANSPTLRRSVRERRPPDTYSP